MPTLLDRWDECRRRARPGPPGVRRSPDRFARLLVRGSTRSPSTERTARHFAISDDGRPAGPATSRPASRRGRPSRRPTLAGLHAGGADGFFTASRLDGPKRVDLLIDAMRHVTGDVTPDHRRHRAGRRAARALAAGDRAITFLGLISDEVLVEALRRCARRAVRPRRRGSRLHHARGAPERHGRGHVRGQRRTDRARRSMAIERLRDRARPRSLGSALPARSPTDPATGAIEPAGPAPAGPNDHVGRRRRQLLEHLAAALDGAVAPSDRSTPRRDRGRSRILTLSTYPSRRPSHGGQIRSQPPPGSTRRDFDVEFLAST